MTTPHNRPHGIILLAHGSRDPLWRKPIEAVAQRIRRDAPSLLVQCAYMELCEPSLNDAVQAMLAQAAPSDSPASERNALHIRIVPLFLGMGKHAREDVPKLVQQLRTTFTNHQFELIASLGEDERVTALLAQLASG